MDNPGQNIGPFGVPPNPPESPKYTLRVRRRHLARRRTPSARSVSRRAVPASRAAAGCAAPTRRHETLPTRRTPHRSTRARRAEPALATLAISAPTARAITQRQHHLLYDHRVGNAVEHSVDHVGLQHGLESPERRAHCIGAATSLRLDRHTPRGAVAVIGRQVGSAAYLPGTRLPSAGRSRGGGGQHLAAQQDARTVRECAEHVCLHGVQEGAARLR
eukprot:scaffold59566_cov36-Phaeocystis_antarctica.AAC.3